MSLSNIKNILNNLDDGAFIDFQKVIHKYDELCEVETNAHDIYCLFIDCLENNLIRNAFVNEITKAFLQ